MSSAHGEITIAELGRRIEALHTDYRSGMQELRERLNAYVLQAVYEADQRHLRTKIEAVKAELDAERAARATEVQAERSARERLAGNLRWVWTAVIVPTAGMVIAIGYDKAGG